MKDFSKLKCLLNTNGGSLSTSVPAIYTAIESNYQNNYSLKFDGVDDYIDCGSGLDIGTRPTTFSAWLKVFDNNLVQNILSTRNSSSGWSFTVNTGASGLTNCEFYNKADTGTIRCNFDTYDEWVHVVLVRGGSGQNAIYVNGVSQALTVDTEVLANPNTSSNLLIGASESTGSIDDVTNGYIDDVLIVNKALSQSEVNELYNNGEDFDYRTVSFGVNILKYWKINEGSGTSTEDCGGYRYDGTLTNGPVWSYTVRNLLPQKSSYALSFDGTNDYVDLGDLSELESSTKLTISAWIKCSNLSNRGSVVSMYDAAASPQPQRVFLFDVNSNGSIRLLKYKDNGGSNYYVETTDETGFDDGEWHHIVGVWDGGSGISSIYIDGSKRSTTSYTNGTGGGSSIHSNSANLYIGAAQSSATTPDILFNGIIDQVFVWADALTIDQVQLLYHYSNKFHPLNNHKSYDKSRVLDLSLELEEGSGTSTLDKSDNKNNGTLTNGPTWTTDVAPITSTSWLDRSSLNFDGTNDYVSIADSASLSFGNGGTDSAFTISAWIYVDTTANFRIAAKGNGASDREWLFTLDTNSKLTFVLYDTDHNNMVNGRFDSAAFLTGVWYHVAATYDGSKSISGVTLYVNGLSVPVLNNSAGSYNGINETSGAMTIGSWDVAGYANGKISHFGAWNSELSASEILAIYNSGNPFDLNYNSGNYTSSDNLVGYWQFNENTGTTLYDYSKNGNDGTLTNGPSWSYALPSSAVLEPKYSVSFDGTNDYISVSDDDSLSFGDGSTDSPFSISMWIKLDANSSGAERLIHKGYAGSPGGTSEFLFTISSLNRYSLQLFDSSSGTYIGNHATETAVRGSWQHVVTTYDGSGNSTNIKIYVNGVLLTYASNSSGSYTAMDANSGNLEIGGLTAGSTYIQGLINSATIISKELSSIEVNELYNSGNLLPIQSFSALSNVVSHWSLNEGSGTTAYDLIGGNNGTLTNGPTWSRDIPWDGSSVKQANNYSLDFDGTNDYITVSDNDSLSFGDGSTDSAFSISAWVKADSWLKFRILTKTNSTNQEFIFGGDGASRLYLYLADNTISNYIGQGSAGALSTGVWYHVVATYDGSGSSSGINVYANGSSVNSGVSTLGSYTAMHNTSANVRIGGLESVPDYGNGKIKELAIYNKELTLNEILSMYNDGEIIDLTKDYGYYKSKANLVAYWPLNEGSGTTATDNSGNGHNGTLTNGPTYSTDVP